jgi:hypothetical protein
MITFFTRNHPPVLKEIPERFMDIFMEVYNGLWRFIMVYSWEKKKNITKHPSIGNVPAMFEYWRVSTTKQVETHPWCHPKKMSRLHVKNQTPAKQHYRLSRCQFSQWNIDQMKLW